MKSNAANFSFLGAFCCVFTNMAQTKVIRSCRFSLVFSPRSLVSQLHVRTLTQDELMFVSGARHGSMFFFAYEYTGALPGKTGFLTETPLLLCRKSVFVWTDSELSAP